MARTDTDPNAAVHPASPPLPPVNWAAIGQQAPVPVVIGPRRFDDPLPAADVVILTWTSAEWSALDQVFLGGANPRNTADSEWKQAWLPYTRGASSFTADPQSGALWGLFCLVT